MRLFVPLTLMIASGGSHNSVHLGTCGISAVQSYFGFLICYSGAGLSGIRMPMGFTTVRLKYCYTCESIGSYRRNRFLRPDIPEPKIYFFANKVCCLEREATESLMFF